MLRIIFFAVIWFASKAYADTYGNVTISQVTSIYDGDTFRANIPGWPAVIGERVPVRIKGIDTPELKGKCQKEKDLARKAKQRSVQLLRNAKTIELRQIERDKYFRLLAYVYVDGLNLGSILIVQGYAAQYHGGKKVNWCD